MSNEIPQENVVWQPIPGSSQELALDTRCDHTLYHGTRGPGKTITQLMRFRRRVGMGYGTYWRGVIFDVEFKNLSDLVAQSKRFFSAFNDGCSFKTSHSEYKWVWPTGEELMFRHVKKLSDYDGFHGHEYPFLGWNELTKQPTPDLYDKMMSTNRSSFTPHLHTPRINGEYDTPDKKPLPPIPLEVFSTTNPSGPGHNWVKRRFISGFSNGEVIRKVSIVFDPKQQKEVELVKKQVSIFGSYRENIYLDAKYIAELDQSTKNNPNLRAAWLEGSWDVTAGGAIDDIWLREIHTVPRFKIPKEWYVDRAFDWGSTHPFSVCWFAESNGEELELDDGTPVCFEKGSIIMINDWYGTEEIGTNKGLKMSAGDVAHGIVLREKQLLEGRWISRKPSPGPADNQIRNVRESDVETIEDKMSEHGIRWTVSDKSPGSRKIGLQLFRDRLQNAVDGEGPGFYVMMNCKASIDTLPSLTRDEKDQDDVDTNCEDHIYDAVRYRVLQSTNRYAKKLEVSYVS